jgi:1-acyl-sn-glycerol-3-phosphate acyltransferase
VAATQPHRREPVYALGEHSIAYGLRAYFRWHLEGLENIPKDAAALVASNHLSYLDGLAVAYGVHRAGRRPRFLTKSSLFKVPVIGPALKGLGQIPVNRGTREAPQSLDNAAAALKAGEVVVVFPEGTTSTAPDLAMGRAKTGTARLALQSGMDVVPCATWGGQWIWTKHLGVHLRPFQDVWVRFGPPISFKEFEGREGDRQAWREVSDRIMGEISGLLADLKVAKPWTPREPTRQKFIVEQAAKKAAADETELQVEAMESEGGPPPPAEETDEKFS